MASKKLKISPTAKAPAQTVKPTVQSGVVGARPGSYGKTNTRNKLATANKRGSKLRGGQSAKNPYGGYRLKP